jgi:hypothetical protein
MTKKIEPNAIWCSLFDALLLDAFWREEGDILWTAFRLSGICDAAFRNNDNDPPADVLTPILSDAVCRANGRTADGRDYGRPDMSTK